MQAEAHEDAGRLRDRGKIIVGADFDDIDWALQVTCVPGLTPRPLTDSIPDNGFGLQTPDNSVIFARDSSDASGKLS